MLHFEIWRMDSVDEHDGIGFAIGQEIFEQVDQLENFLYKGENLSLDIDTPHHDDDVIEFIKENARLIVDMSKKMPELEEMSAQFGYGVLCPFFFYNYSWTLFRILFRFTPTNRKQVQDMVKFCKSKNMKMGAAGFRGSWSAVFPDCGGMLFDLRNLRLDNGKKITFNGDEKDPKITISPGVTEKKLKGYFLKNNLCFYSDVIVESVTYGGVVSGGSHGTGKDQKSVSDYLTELKIVNAEGEIVVYSETSNPQQLPAAKVNLGLFGIAVEYTFKVKPMAYVKVDLLFGNKLRDVFGTPDKIKTLWDENWSLEIVVNQIKMDNIDDSRVTIRAVKDAPTPIGKRWCPWGFMKIPYAIHFLFGTMHLIPLYAMEFCFPYKPETVKKAMDDVMDVLKAQRSNFPSRCLKVFVDVRFIQYSDTLLCPAIFKDHSFYIQVLLPRFNYAMPDCQHFYKALAEKWYKLEGIPHWHKDWDYLPGVDDQIKKIYGRRIQRFEEIRKDVDPNELFLNKRMKKLFQE